MKSFVTLVVSAGFAVLVLAAPALSAGTKIINRSGVPVDELAVSAPGTKQWGANLLDGTKDGVLDNGKSYTVKDLGDGIYDFQIAAPDEAIFCVMPNVVVKKGVATLTQAMGKACK